MLSIRSEMLDKMIFFGTRSLDRALADYELHFRTERNHQGLENKLIEPAPDTGSQNGVVRRRERLGGLLSYYYRHTA